MNLAKITIWGLAMILLLLSGCVREPVEIEVPPPVSTKLEVMRIKDVSPQFFELIEHGDFDDITLTIYSMSRFDFTTTLPVSIYHLINWWDDYKTVVIVSGEDLVEYHGLLKQIINAELIPIDREPLVCIRLYYVFEHSEYGELFTFAGFGARWDMFVNGIEVEHNHVFYELALPFLPENLAGEIERFLDGMDQL